MNISWESIYQRDLKNYESFGDEGEIWFGESSVETMMDWVMENCDKESSIIDIGCGNGHLLFELVCVSCSRVD